MQQHSIRKALSIALLLFSTVTSYAQLQTQTVKVWGNCGMCKKTIEKSVTVAGVEKADWNKDTKRLTVSFDPALITLDQIEKKVAEAGYDNEAYAGDDTAYGKLPPCCQYDRKGAVENTKATLWPPLDEAHMAMMNVMHPLMMNNDLAPARANATLLLSKLKSMAVASNRPATISEKQLTEIVAKGEAYAAVVAENGPDKQLKKSLMTLRAVFHPIVPEEMRQNMMPGGKMKGMHTKMHRAMMNR